MSGLSKFIQIIIDFLLIHKKWERGFRKRHNIWSRVQGLSVKLQWQRQSGRLLWQRASHLWLNCSYKRGKVSASQDLHWLKFSFFADDTVCLSLVCWWRSAPITSSVDALTSRWRAQTWYLYLWQMWSELGACHVHSWRTERETESKRGFGNQTHAPPWQKLQPLFCQSDYSRITRR